MKTIQILASDLLLSSLKKHTKFEKSNIVVGNGAIELIYNFCSAFMSKNSKVLIAVPTFQEYETASILNNASLTLFQIYGFSHKTLIHLFQKFQKKDLFLFVIQIILLEQYFHENKCAKNNYCGKKTYHPLVFVDECFIEMVPKFK